MFDRFTENHVESLFKQLKEIVDKHNLYFESLSKYNLSKVVNNINMLNMYDVINDPSNLISAHTSVDGTTGPLKDIANKSSEAADASFRTPGNFNNKFESIVENLVGKKGISICATGLKSFFGLTLYYNTLLNEGDAKQLEKVLLDHGLITIGGKKYKTLANIRAISPNSIINDDIIRTLASVNNDMDSALILSALLSLSTDNAKELALSKLNASTETLGLYVYGISIGMDFKDIADIMMSDVGKVINEVLNSNVFTEKQGYGSVGESVFKYFDKGPSRLLRSFDVYQDIDKNNISSPYETLKKLFEKRVKYKNDKGKTMYFPEAVAKFAKEEGKSLSEKLNFFENLRKGYVSDSTSAVELYNLLIDAVEDYIQLSHIILQNLSIYEDIRTLSEGAAEMRILGQLFGLNKGLETSSDKLISQIHNIERAIYNKTGDVNDIINLTEFALNEEYRQEKIDKYDEVKHSFNILDAISKVPHFMGYLLTLATADRELQQSFKYRSIRKLSLDVSNKLNYNKETNVAKGILNFVGDWMRNDWLKTTDAITIPSGNKAFTRNRNLIDLQLDSTLLLGTDWNNATFRMWMENEVIPNLKKGIIKLGTKHSGIISNKFVLDLGNDLFTTTTSHNPSVIYALPINMLPRTNRERAIFNLYKSEFNKLAAFNYEYNVTSYDNDGNVITEEKSIPIVNLFTYYAMIANNWKLGEKSLVPILEDFLNTGIIKLFHEYIAQLDSSGFALELKDIDFKRDLLPYVAPFESSYSSYAKYIWERNRTTKVYELKEQEDYRSYSKISDFTNDRYFYKGTSESPTARQKISITENGLTHDYMLRYYKDTGEIERLADSTDNTLNIEGLTHVPTKKVNGRKMLDIDLLESIIKNKEFPCSPA